MNGGRAGGVGEGGKQPPVLSVFYVRAVAMLQVNLFSLNTSHPRSELVYSMWFMLCKCHIGSNLRDHMDTILRTISY